MADDETAVRIPPDVWANCEARIEGTDFDTVEEYIRFVVTEVSIVSNDDDATHPRRVSDSDEVTDRLESLGYL